MPSPVIRGTKLPLSWSTGTATGYVVEKYDDDDKVDNVLLEDEDSQYTAEITGLRPMSDVTLEVMPLSTVSSPPDPGDEFTYGGRKISIKSIKKSRAKGQAVKWTMTGVHCPLIHV